jgi:hypothetical protein
VRSLALPVLVAALTLLPACPPVPDPPGPCEIHGAPGLVDGRVANPWPSYALMRADEAMSTGCRLAMPDDALPLGIDAHPLDLRRFDDRDGFSPAGSLWLQLHQTIDPTALPGPQDPAASLSSPAVQIWDLDTGERLPFWAEIDAYPDLPDADRSLLLRPARAWPWGHRVAVVLTSALGASVTSPSPFQDARAGDPDDPQGAHVQDLLRRLVALGVVEEDVILAWDFPIATAATVHRRLDAVIAGVREGLPDDPAFQPALDLSVVLDADDPAGDAPTEGLWREVRGSFPLTHYLWPEQEGDDADRGIFQLDADLLPVANAAAPAYFTLVVPESVRHAAAGTVPVLIFGHGIFSNPRAYLAEGGDPHGVIALLNRLGAIGIGGEWRGLTTRDATNALLAAMDWSRFPMVTDKLIQGVANQLALERLVRTAMREEPWLQAEGGGSLIDPERTLYFGISLGGIEGAVLLAHSEHIDSGVLHVGGSAWSTMLERSSNWTDFETYVVPQFPDAADRQLQYAVSQLLWDPVDPLNHVDALRGRNVLWQESVNDEQVPNLTTELIARTLGVPLLAPSPREPWDLPATEGPLGPGASAVAIFDGGFPAPPLGNRPAVDTGAHREIRSWESVQAQVEAFFTPGAEGTIVQPCGGPCLGP